MDRAAKMTQRLGEQTSGGDSVNIEIAEDGDDLTRGKSRLHTIGHSVQAGNDRRVGPVALERGSEEQAPLLD